MKLSRGALVGGQFLLGDVLGRGGMGEVWDAVDRRSRARVAVKVLLPKAAARPDLVERFAREGRMLRRIDSPNVCRLLESGQDDGGVPFLVFERLEGEELSRLLKRVRVLPLADVAPLVAQMFQGLLVAHAAGVVHRDLKPSNVMLVPAWGGGIVVKLLDFGVSKLLSGAEDTLTTDGATLGSMSYMAPEQMGRAREIDPRVDVYSAATIAFRALTGRLPFDGDAVTLVAMKTSTTAPSLGDLTNARWPDDVEEFMRTALARAPAERYPTTAHAAEAWRAACLAGTAPDVSLQIPVDVELDAGDATASLAPASERRDNERG